MKKILQLHRYYNKTLNHIFSSQFVADNIKEVPKLNRFALSIESKKIKKTHYLFIYLLTNKKGHMIKYNIPWKFKAQTGRIVKNSKILCRLSAKRTEKILHEERGNWIYKRNKKKLLASPFLEIWLWEV